MIFISLLFNDWNPFRNFAVRKQRVFIETSFIPIDPTYFEAENMLKNVQFSYEKVIIAKLFTVSARVYSGETKVMCR